MGGVGSIPAREVFGVGSESGDEGLFSKAVSDELTTHYNVKSRLTGFDPQRTVTTRKIINF